MAEYMFRRQIRDSHPDWKVCSAGVMAGRGAPASRFGVKALRELAIDMKKHRSQPVTDELVEQARLIVVMSQTHRDILLERYPESGEKIAMLKSFDAASDGGDVLDPIGMSLDIYRHIRNEIGDAMWGLENYLDEMERDSGK
jgi:protein-tyrosine phosphatase